MQEEEFLTQRQEQVATSADTRFDECRRRGDFPKNLDVVSHLQGLITDHPDFELLGGPKSGFYCFRYVPNGLAERQEEAEVEGLLNRLNQEIVEVVRRRGLAEVMTIDVDGRSAIRISIGSTSSLPNDIDATFETIAGWGRLLNKTLSVRY